MQKSKTIWILEDDAGCRFVYDEILKSKYSLVFYESIKDFLEAAHSNQSRPEIAIVDLNLSDGNFLDHLGQMETENALNLPFFVVSSNHDIGTFSSCFEEGALDYMTKPFNKNEFLFKLERAIESHKSTSQEKSEKSMTVLEPMLNLLTMKEQKLFKEFWTADDHIVTKAVIFEKIWAGTAVHPKVLDVHLYNLRRKISKWGYKIVSKGSGVWKLERFQQIG